ncbi:MAG: nicotinamide-nucleotide amidohydrolase family protein [bacterium]|nr:nicotinamide-nucleotide amidohydrolase family protein [bacterium]
MKINVISIGDELLRDKLNTNLLDIGKHLYIQKAVIIRDEKQSIWDALGIALDTADLVLVTGGLGPTIDDITEPVVMEFFQDANFNNLDIEKLPNQLGIANGLLIKYHGKQVALLPGPPNEMNHVFLAELLPRLHLDMPAPNELFFKTFGLTEVEIQDKILAFAKSRSIEFFLALLPEFSVTVVKVICDDEKFKTEVIELFKDNIWTFKNISIAECLVDRLVAKNLKLAVAESCTGGLLSKLITDVKGSSCCFLGGVTAYSNQLKRDLLGVKNDLLVSCGAVSSEVVKSMAEQILLKTNADLAIAVTGIAGPSGGERDKSVGLVHFAIAEKGKKTEVFWINKLGNRETIRMRASVYGIGRLLIRLYFNILKTK